MDLIERHEQHAREKRASLAVVAKQLLAEKEFSLKTPVAIDCDGMVEAAPVGTVYAGLSHPAGKDAVMKVKPFGYLAAR